MSLNSIRNRERARQHYTDEMLFITWRAQQMQRGVWTFAVTGSGTGQSVEQSRGYRSRAAEEWEDMGASERLVWAAYQRQHDEQQPQILGIVLKVLKQDGQMKYVRDYCREHKWLWVPQAAQMPHANVLDLVVFPAMSKRHSRLLRQWRGKPEKVKT